jgi:glycosyltransferase involved in cell wall biosynthesis
MQSAAKLNVGINLMKVSAVITCYESIGTIELTILSLATQSREPDEIIVTDDGSSEETCQRVKRILAMVSDLHGIPTEFVTHERTTPYRLNTIRNAGISRASGDIVFLVDGDILVPREMLSAHETIHDHLLQSSRRAFISCVRKNLSGMGHIGEGRISDWGHQLDRFLLSKQWDQLNLEPEQTLSQSSFLRSDWANTGGFDTDFDGHWGYDEVEFAYRLKAMGTILTSHGVVFHLVEKAALGTRDSERNRALYYKKRRYL